MSLKQKNRKFKTRIKLNHNIYIVMTHFFVNWASNKLAQTDKYWFPIKDFVITAFSLKKLMNFFKGDVAGRWAKELMNHSMTEYLMKNC